jgi:hypothetical protein
MDALLVRAGYELLPVLEGEYVSHQATYIRRRHGAPVHEVDVHWRLASPGVFADLPSFGELWRRAEPLPGLTPSARGPGLAHALLVACVHRVAHHFNSDAFIWCYDIHLLAKAMGRGDWDDFVDAAGRGAVASVCRDSLIRALRWFGAPVPDDVLADLQRVAERAEREASAAYLSPARRPVHDIVDDLRALPTWSARCRLVSERLFPSRHFMREVYAPASRVPLAGLYVWRALQGARRSFSRR